MPIRLEAYTASGVLQADASVEGTLGEVLETFDEVPLVRGIVSPLDGSVARAVPPGPVGIDDLIVVVAATPPSVPVHANWHELALRAGPYFVRGEMPTLPGFDPGRALARPSGPFVLLRSVEISIAAASEAGTNDHAYAWVNRYNVDAVAGDLNLALFFPGADETLGLPGSKPADIRS
jgi:hypothetical protein